MGRRASGSGAGKRKPARPDAAGLVGTEFAGCHLDERSLEDHHGALYSGRDAKSGREVSVRVLARRMGSERDVATQFVRRSLLVAKLRHPAIPLVHRVGRDEALDLHYSVGERTGGPTLRDLVNEETRFDVPACIEVLRQSCDALAVLHDQDLIHGDLSPKVLGWRDERLKFLDVTLPRRRGSSPICVPYYAAPEVLDHRGLEVRSDQYSLGAVAYFLLSGRPPHRGTDQEGELRLDGNLDELLPLTARVLMEDPKPLSEISPSVPPALWAVIRRLLARRAADRFADVRDVLAALDALPSRHAVAAGATEPEGGGSPEDLTNDRLLAPCARVLFEGTDRPTLGRLVLLSRLGQGGMGAVYRAVNPRVGTACAVKVLWPELVVRDPRFVERFFREARLAASIESPHVVRVIDADHDTASGAHYLVMDLVAGRSALEWARRTDGRLALRDAIDAVTAATRGLAAAHARGIVHRDVKPENVLVPADAGGGPAWGSAKLSDLGLARSEDVGPTLTSTGAPMGTPGFMPPEQIRSPRYAREPADVFAMGATLYALLAGAPPFGGESLVDVIARTERGEYEPLATRRPDVPAAVVDLVDRCLRGDPAARPADAGTLLASLEALGSASGG